MNYPVFYYNYVWFYLHWMVDLYYNLYDTRKGVWSVQDLVPVKVNPPPLSKRICLADISCHNFVLQWILNNFTIQCFVIIILCIITNNVTSWWNGDITMDILKSLLSHITMPIPMWGEMTVLTVTRVISNGVWADLCMCWPCHPAHEWPYSYTAPTRWCLFSEAIIAYTDNYSIVDVHTTSTYTLGKRTRRSGE